MYVCKGQFNTSIVVVVTFIFPFHNIVLHHLLHFTALPPLLKQASFPLVEALDLPLSTMLSFISSSPHGCHCNERGFVLNFGFLSLSINMAYVSTTRTVSRGCKESLHKSFLLIYPFYHMTHHSILTAKALPPHS